MDPDDRIRVVVVEDEALYRDLLVTALDTDPALAVVGDFGRPELALDALAHLAPEVLVVDVELGSSLNGIQLALQARQRLPGTGIVVLSNHDDPRWVQAVPPEALTGWSFLLKGSVSDISALVRAIRGAHGGLLTIDPQILANRSDRAGHLALQLTPRQSEILDRMTEGQTNASIAAGLYLSERTVENHVRDLYRRLGVDAGDRLIHPRVQAVLTHLGLRRLSGPRA